MQNEVTTKAIPQPPENFLIGNLAEIDSRFSLGSFFRLHKLYGDIFKLVFPGGRKVVIVCTQELVNYVCDETKFRKILSKPLTEVRNLTGDGLFTANNDEPNWALAHKILVPAFGPMAIRGMFPQMMDIASQLLLKWERFAGDDIDVCSDFTRLTLDTLALCGFDYRFNSFYREKMHYFVESMVHVLTESGVRANRLSNLPFVSANHEYFENIKKMHALCDEIVRYRKEHPTDTNDLLNRMINGKDPDTGYKLSDENIRYQMVTFLVAGHETTSGLLSFTFYFLLKNPHAMQKAREEADSFDVITIDTLSKLKYIDAVLKEALRLQPTASLLSRGCLAEKEILPGGYQITKDDTVAILLHQLHRDPKVWKDPDEFRPERMLDGGFENLPPNSWKPFGTGDRSCIGRPFAWQESLLVVALVLKHFNLEMVDPTYDLRIKQTLTIKPDGFKIRTKPRKSSSNLSQSDNIKSEPVKPEVVHESKKSITTTPLNLKPICVLYGSNSGSCESFANTIASEGRIHGFTASVATLNSATGSLPADRPVVIITASYEGKPTNNADQFIAYLEQIPKLPNIKYAVFGAGHHDWVTTYMKIPIFVDETLAKCGGQRIIPRGVGDAAGDFFGSFESWKEDLFNALKKEAGVETVTTKEEVTITIVSSARNIGQITEVGTITENTVLAKASELGPEKRHIVIDLPKGQTYRSGDYLAILPLNPPETVRRVLTRFSLPAEAQVKIQSQLETFLPTNYPISAYDLLAGYVELSQPITRKQIVILSEHCKKEAEKSSILTLGGDAYEKSVLHKRLSTLDVLELNPSCEITFAQYLRMLPSLRVRQYSISSSPLWNSEAVTLSIDVLEGPAISGHGRYHGVASFYLSKLRPGDKIPCGIRPSNSFHLPPDPQTPIVMLSAGTGLAPFRGFIQERAAQLVCGRKVGETILYFGCRSEEDFIYKEELARWENLGAVKIRHVFSRNSTNNLKYVQDRLWEEREDIKRLFKEGALFYTCGSATKLAASVKQCFIKIISESKKCDEAEAQRIFEKLSQERYSVDVFA
jgi:cytochrome P450/NADPH-cytochrome P450 reductase